MVNVGEFVDYVEYDGKVKRCQVTSVNIEKSVNGDTYQTYDLYNFEDKCTFVHAVYSDDKEQKFSFHKLAVANVAETPVF